MSSQKNDIKYLEVYEKTHHNFKPQPSANTSSINMKTLNIKILMIFRDDVVQTHGGRNINNWSKYLIRKVCLIQVLYLVHYYEIDVYTLKLRH